MFISFFLVFPNVFGVVYFFFLMFLVFLNVFPNVFRWSPRGRPWPRGRLRGHILKSLALALASKPQVLGLRLGLEALGPRKLPCPRLEDSTIFEPLKFC